MIKKAIGFALIAMLVFYVATDPSGAATTVHGAVRGLATAGASFGAFVKGL